MRVLNRPFLDQLENRLIAAEDAIEDLGLGGIADGDYGDITLIAGVVTIDNDVVSNAKLADMAEATVKGRATGAGTGDPTDLSAT